MGFFVFAFSVVALLMSFLYACEKVMNVLQEPEKNGVNAYEMINAT